MSAPASVSFSALGTTAIVAVTRPEVLVSAHDELAAELAALDLACSRFRPDSELGRLDDAHGSPVPASDLLLDALAAALRAARLTGGLVTPTLGASLHAAGYDRDFARIAPRLDPPRYVAAPDWRAVRIDRVAGTVCVPDGVGLDLGATAKAFAADRAAATIAARAGCGVLVGLGGDLAVAGQGPQGGWRIWVDDAHDEPSPRAERMRLHDGGLATSSTTQRRWRRGGEQLHHVLEPATGRPASTGWRTVSVAAASCLDANTASTASLLLGAAAPDWLAARELPARLVADDGGLTRVGLWPEAELVAA